MKLIQEPRIYIIEMTYDELADLANLGYYTANADSPTWHALKKVALQAGVDFTGDRRSIVPER